MSTAHQQIKELAKGQGCSYRKLIALAPQNDPFYAGSKGNRIWAEWFANLWARFGFESGAHLRRIHYRLVSEEGFQKADGSPYQNTEKDWARLCVASKQARYLDLISAEMFVDRRNPGAHIYFDGTRGKEPEPNYSVDPIFWNIPNWRERFPDESFSFDEPSGSVSGYDYSDADQAYHLEIWAEKSTMDDILLPLGQHYGINVVTSLGYQSITSIVGMCKRVAEIGKPVRIFYISDLSIRGFDARCRSAAD